MCSFARAFIDQLRFHPSTAWYLSQCGEALGMQELWKKARPEILKNLRESTNIQSTESSNRIEGVEVKKDRIVPLVLGNATPRDRSEEEITGYRKAKGTNRLSLNLVSAFPQMKDLKGGFN